MDALDVPENIQNPLFLNIPQHILSAWTALEVLSPQSFKEWEDLVSGDKWRIANIEQGSLPWENGGEKSRPNYRLYYQIILGTIDMPKAVSDLLEVYTDSREERPQARGQAVLASVMVDKNGIPVKDEPFFLSSFGWGLPVALKGNLKDLDNWPAVETAIVTRYTKQLLNLVDEKGQPRPVSRRDIDDIYSGLVSHLNLPEHLLNPPQVAVRTYQYFKNKEPPEPILLNSFYLQDLAAVRNMFAQNRATNNLELYLGKKSLPQRQDLLSDDDAIASALEPAKFPLGSWPGNGRHPLVTLQQCAVNLSIHELKKNGILAVNGPPGTGKTTLLRDIVADIVTERASAMVTYRNPENAFEYTGQRISRGNAFLSIYSLRQKLRGYEMVVASSNNKAVENVSAELPGTEAIADDGNELRYLRTTSDALLGHDTWGLIAAVLGNAANRNKFRQSFWWNDDTGLRRYLLEACGTPQFIADNMDNGPEQRIPLIIQNEDPPSNHNEALRRWRKARDNFKSIKLQVEQRIFKIQELYEIQKRLSALADIIFKLKSSIIDIEENIRQSNIEVRNTKLVLRDFDADFKTATSVLATYLGSRPGFWSRLFKTQKYKEWQRQYLLSKEDYQILERDILNANHRLALQNKVLDQHQNKHKQLTSQYQSKTSECASLDQKYETYLSYIKATPIDDKFYFASHEERQNCAPWLDEETKRLRQDLFEASIAVHKAFIDAAAKPIRHNLSVFMDSFGTRSLGSDAKDKYIRDLWATFFLVVPVVSTTFASVARMFNRIGPEQLGWLLIDEAGQALPQAAVGAIMRTKRAVVVGDPIQIEPVVVLPEKLTETICERFEVDPQIYNAPSASAQTLADSATPYMGAFETEYGTREVGVPLLVHRRCSEPMFRISNSVAYENLMVQAKTDKPSAIRDILGESRWIHVEGAGQDKWCRDEGEKVLELLKQLRAQGCQPDLYIVTPFVVVQHRMRDLIRSSRILSGWVEKPGSWVYERIGTVHTVQGREAEAVIFILGAPHPNQNGARYWAGGRPNLLNVAVTRAKEALYVVGNKTLWEKAGTFGKMSRLLT